MCGLTGLVTTSQGEHRDGVRAMVDRLEHRGPDGQSVWSDGFATLGHTRLAIIDVPGGGQPLFSEDERFVMIYNGEIYNFRSLRRELEERGHRFRTNTDGEVVVHLYEEMGRECLGKLRGMFAIAIWDVRERSLMLARDRMGQKPLVYRTTPDGIAFASELAGLPVPAGETNEVDDVAVDEYLTYGYVPEPRTIWRGVSKLPPAHALIWKEGSAELFACWSVGGCVSRPLLTERQASESLRETLTESVRLRLVSDVGVGAFLSGGLDSSIVVGLMARESGARVKTFSVGFEESGYSELEYARAVANKHNTDHTEFMVGPESTEVLPELVRHFGEPFADSSALPTYQVSRATSGAAKVALSGDGGDELFSGYVRYEALRVASMLRGNPVLGGTLSRPWWPRLHRAASERRSVLGRMQRFADSVTLEDFPRYLAYVSVWTPEEKAQVYHEGFRRTLSGHDAGTYLKRTWERFGDCDLPARAAFTDMLTYLPGDLLTKVDITSMFHGLEVRSPFLDHHVVELAMRIPTRLKRQGFTGKRILRRTFADLLPEEVLRRSKQGFAAPVSRWFRGRMREYLRETLCSRDACIFRYFRPEAVHAMVSEHVSERRDLGAQLWSLLMLELWHRQFAP